MNRKNKQDLTEGPVSPSKTKRMYLKKKRQNSILIKGIVITVVVVFICALGLWGQHLWISYLDQQVRALEEEVDVIRSENDTKQGQLTESQNDQTIKSTARSYGMQGASADQKIVETISEQKINERVSEKNAWYHRLFE